MPLYDLVCHPCKLVFEDVHGSYENVKGSSCPECSAPREIKLPSLRYIWKAGNYGGDASEVRRFEMISKEVELAVPNPDKDQGGYVRYGKRALGT